MDADAVTEWNPGAPVRRTTKVRIGRHECIVNRKGYCVRRNHPTRRSYCQIRHARTLDIPAPPPRQPDRALRGYIEQANAACEER